MTPWLSHWNNKCISFQTMPSIIFLSVSHNGSCQHQKHSNTIGYFGKMKIACGATSRLKLRVSTSLLVGTFFFKIPSLVSLCKKKKKKRLISNLTSFTRSSTIYPCIKIGTDRSYSCSLLWVVQTVTAFVTMCSLITSTVMF